MFEPGKLVIVSAGWTPQEVDGFRERLRPLGYQVDDTQGRLTLTPAKFKPNPAAAGAPGLAQTSSSRRSQPTVATGRGPRRAATAGADNRARARRRTARARASASAT
ncbi:hypothetical protein [Ideonella paludis]|uniref:hypothetical protein n=1 Tax=Ideonella paludis TaxID=1233411 RepID=UPI003632685A